MNVYLVKYSHFTKAYVFHTENTFSCGYRTVGCALRHDANYLKGNGAVFVGQKNVYAIDLS